MKAGEIKLEALSVMNILLDARPDYRYMDGYLCESKYQKYLLNMDESIKRALDIISSQNVLEEKSFMASECEYLTKNGYIVLSLNQIQDYKSIKKVVDVKDKINNVRFDVVAKKLIIYSQSADDIIIVYYPRVIVPENITNDTVIDLPDSLARIIPYYIKYDLYQEDEPNLAMVAKSQFYTLLENYSLENLSDEFYIEKVYEV